MYYIAKGAQKQNLSFKFKLQRYIEYKLKVGEQKISPVSNWHRLEIFILSVGRISVKINKYITIQTAK